MTARDAQSAFRALSGVLWQERAALERVLDDEGCDEGFRKHHLLALLEVERSVATYDAARTVGVDRELSLLELAAVAPVGWAAVLRGHWNAMTALTDTASRCTNGTTVGAAQRSLQEFLS